MGDTSLVVQLLYDEPQRSLVRSVSTQQLFWLDKTKDSLSFVGVSFGDFEVETSRLTLYEHRLELEKLVLSVSVTLNDAVEALLREGVLDPAASPTAVRNALLRRGIVAITTAGTPNASVTPNVVSKTTKSKVTEEV